MKKLFCLSFVLLAFTGVFAQERKIEQTEFDTIHQNSVEKLKGKSYRVTTTLENKTENSSFVSFPTNTRFDSPYNPNDEQLNSTAPNLGSGVKPVTSLTKTVTEVSANGGFRLTSETDLKSFKWKKEIIKIGDKTYIQEGNREWKEINLQNFSPISRVFTQPKTETEYKFLGTNRLDNQIALIYQVSEKRNYNGNVSTISKTKYWFSEDGRLLRKEADVKTSGLSNSISRDSSALETFNNNFSGRNSLSTDRSSKTKTRSHIVTVYEFDQNIKIEVPIIKTEAK